MKQTLLIPTTFVFLLLFTAEISMGQNKTLYDELLYVNKEWNNQDDADAMLKEKAALPLNEKELVRMHLRQVEILLRKRSTAGLTAMQKKNREKNLDVLHGYLEKGVFPINTQHTARQPYFIDEHNTYCAVGYLMKESGADDVAMYINKTQNYNYLADIDHPRLMQWVSNSGLDFGELALIQPGYGFEWPASVVEMHYNNTGTDINEYIEIHQSTGGLVGMLPIDTVKFLDYNGVLYKTLLMSDLPHYVSSVAPGAFYYYNFPANEDFADSGKVLLIAPFSGWGHDTVSVLTYTSQHITLADTYSQEVTEYSVGENESTPAGSAITFCGVYGSSWSPNLLPATPGTANPCTLGVLPITLSSFNYVLEQKNVVLKWQTASEINSDHFEIERSSDGVHFTSIGSVNAVGNSSVANQYTFTDPRPNYLNHYRLKQVDADGKAAYSKILFVKVEAASLLSLPENPVKNALKVVITGMGEHAGVLSVYEFSGKEVFQQQAKNGSQTINVSQLPPGKYIVRLHMANDQVYTRQFVKG